MPIVAAIGAFINLRCCGGGQHALAIFIAADKENILLRQAAEDMRPALAAIVAAIGAFMGGDPNRGLAPDADTADGIDAGRHSGFLPGSTAILRYHYLVKRGGGDYLTTGTHRQDAGG